MSRRHRPINSAGSDPLVPTLFHERWWLDIVTGGRWHDIEVRDSGRVVGRMPITMGRGFGLPVIGMPPLTHFLGPAVSYGEGAPPTRWLRRVEIIRELARSLPRAAWFWQKCHRGLTDVVPFQAERFMTHVQFTFEVAPAPEPALWNAMRDKTRNVVRKGLRDFVVQDLADPAEFTRFYRQNLQRRDMVDWNGGTLTTRVLAASLERGAATLIAVRDRGGDLAAAIFCPHDAAVSYYKLSTRLPEAGNGAIPVLIWEAIRRAAAAGRVFDFDGLSTSHAIGLFAGFGGTVCPRYVVHRNALSPLVRAVRRRLGLGTSLFGS